MKIKWNFIKKFKESLFGDYRFIFYHGGRAGGKSQQIAMYFIFESVREKHRYLCVREVQNSIDESVYYLLKEIITKQDLLQYFKIINNRIECLTTGSVFVFKGLKTATGQGDSIKSFEGFDRVWGEEAHSFSEQSIEKLLPTIRTSGARFFFSFNRALNNDPIWKLSKQDLPKKYIMQINYYDNPYCPEIIKQQADSLKKIDYQRYLHVYEGYPDDNVENAIINRQWVKAAYDLYKNEDISGIKVVALDPADEGVDKNATCHRWGNAIVYMSQWHEGDTKQTTHKTIRLAKENGFYPPSRFVFDRVGVGAGVRAEIKEYPEMKIIAYNGGDSVLNPNHQYEVGIRNKDMFENLKAQDWWYVRDLFLGSYRKLNGEDVEDYIVVNPDIKDEFGNPLRDRLEDELCQVTKKESSRGKMLIDKKPKGTVSPNLADCLVLSFTKKGTKEIIIKTF